MICIELRMLFVADATLSGTTAFFCSIYCMPPHVVVPWPWPVVMLTLFSVCQEKAATPVTIMSLA